MTIGNLEREDLLKRAFANLTSIREHVTLGNVFQDTHLNLYNKALGYLKQAGEDVSEWRLPPTAEQGAMDSSELRALIDSILVYFQLKESKASIGFQR